MSDKHFMIAINWAGPYPDIDEARRVARTDFDHGLYMCIGMCKGQRKSVPQYVGIGENVSSRLNIRHAKLQQVTRQHQIWLGEIATAEPSGRKLKVTRPTLDYAEWLHARFMKLPLNEKKRKALPDRSVTVLNRWWKTDYETLQHRRPHPDWPDLIDFPSYDLPARMVWFGQRQRRFLSPDYAEP